MYNFFPSRIFSNSPKTSIIYPSLSHLKKLNHILSTLFQQIRTIIKNVILYKKRVQSGVWVLLCF